jgi:hypothetical protein
MDKDPAGASIADRMGVVGRESRRSKRRSLTPPLGDPSSGKWFSTSSSGFFTSRLLAFQLKKVYFYPRPDLP